jgi:hypothetical protein
MRVYDHKGEPEILKTDLNEITVNEFQLIANLSKKGVEGYEYYLQIFEILGLSRKFCDEMSAPVLFDIVKEFNDDFEIEKGVFVREIDIDGYTYRSFEDTFTLNARVLSKIEKRFEQDWFTYALALIFKRTDLSINDETDAHIKHKESLFRNVTLDVALPFLYTISNDYIENISLLLNEK